MALKLPPSDPVRAMGRYRLHVGDLIVDMRASPPHSGADYRVPAHRALLLVPLGGDLEILTEAHRHDCPENTPFLFARGEEVTALWREGSWCLAIHLRRDRLNAALSAAVGGACKLTSVATLLQSGRELEQTLHLLLALVADAEPQQRPALLAIEANFYRRLAERLLPESGGEKLFTPVRSVSEAMRLVREDHSRAYDTEELATLVGVTAQTLRKGFRFCLGMSVKEYIQTVRLDWAHARLASGRDGRPIAEIARRAGFAESSPFSRAYMRRFGEPPSQTRAMAVRAATV
ncbi:helix-turn-helix domain-containing protein [Sandaracinobacter sp. RS1-74]|uniref:AraC family transcriptional regulator n=1 Tax=Sandaracinobacteroides sayramensis TaxID=2913411 RepID=UPI001EDB4188|nr:helix-turn-helix domain-containing protein [Sandaracinobacteroides sayramensis]MCG2840439.1 helix-turn-helix domain-containing protein [Sandaracinobacteroides sayramensis]